MGTQSKRKSKMPLKLLQFKTKKDAKNIWSDYINIYDAASKSGYTTTAIYNWIRKKKIEAWQYRGMIVISRNQKLPPGTIIGKRTNLADLELPK